MTVRKLTPRVLAADAVNRWLETYGEDGDGYGADKVVVLTDLRALGNNPCPAEVNRVIGNKSWTQVPACEGCDNETPRSVVQFVADADYSGTETHLCRECVLEAARLYRLIPPTS